MIFRRGVASLRSAVARSAVVSGNNNSAAAAASISNSNQCMQVRCVGTVKVKGAHRVEAMRAAGTLNRSLQREKLQNIVKKRQRFETGAALRLRKAKDAKRKQRHRTLYSLYKRHEERKERKATNQLYKEGVL